MKLEYVVSIQQNINRLIRVITGNSTITEECQKRKILELEELLKNEASRTLELTNKLVELQQADDAKDMQGFSAQFQLIKKVVQKELGDDFKEADWPLELKDILESFIQKETVFDELAKMVLENEVKFLTTSELTEQLHLFLKMHKARISDLGPNTKKTFLQSIFSKR